MNVHIPQGVDQQSINLCHSRTVAWWRLMYISYLGQKLPLESAGSVVITWVRPKLSLVTTWVRVATWVGTNILLFPHFCHISRTLVGGRCFIWSVVCGRSSIWSVVGGEILVWSVVFMVSEGGGRWSVFCNFTGRWSGFLEWLMVGVLISIWLVVCGSWSIVCGLWSVAGRWAVVLY